MERGRTRWLIYDRWNSNYEYGNCWASSKYFAAITDPRDAQRVLDFLNGEAA